MDLTGPDLLASYHAALSPFLMMTSCATLVWSLQNRYSQVVHALRKLAAMAREETDVESKLLAVRQIRILQRRSRLLRNRVVGYYLATGSFLLTSALLFNGIQTNQFVPTVIITTFITDLAFVLGTLVYVLLDSRHIFEAIADQIGNLLQ